MPVFIGKLDTIITGNVHSGIQKSKRSAPQSGGPFKYVANTERSALDLLDADVIWEIFHG